MSPGEALVILRRAEYAAMNLDNALCELTRARPNWSCIVSWFDSATLALELMSKPASMLHARIRPTGDRLVELRKLVDGAHPSAALDLHFALFEVAAHRRAFGSGLVIEITALAESARRKARP